MITSAKSKWAYVLVAFLALGLCTTVLVLNRTDQTELSETYSSGHLSTLFILGEVQHVLAGDLVSAMYFDEDVSQVAFALGAGTLGSIDRTGELMVVAGGAYVKPSDSRTNYDLETSSKIMTPFCFGLESGAKPSAIYVLENNDEKEYSISRLYDVLSDDHERLFAVFGMAQFKQIEVTAIKLAPIYGEMITDAENTQKYFHTPAPVEDRVAVFFGVVNNPNREPRRTYNATMENRIFYVNPAEKVASELRSHTHVLITSASTYALSHLDSEEELLRVAKAFSIIDMGHLLTQSLLQRAVIIVYDVDRMINTSRIDSQVTAGEPILSIKENIAFLPLCAPASVKNRLSYCECRAPIRAS